MLALLKRKAANDFSRLKAMVGGEFTVWLEMAGVEYAITGISGKVTDAGAAMPSMGFLRKPVSDISFMLAIADLPTGYILKEAARFHASPTGTRATAKAYKIESWEDQSALASHIQINGSKGK
jgi:hypothetical protein